MIKFPSGSRWRLAAVSAKVPPTNPPTSSFRSSWLDFGRAGNCSERLNPAGPVSFQLFYANSDHMISDSGQCVALCVPVLICSFCCASYLIIHSPQHVTSYSKSCTFKVSPGAQGNRLSIRPQISSTVVSIGASMNHILRHGRGTLLCRYFRRNPFQA